MEAPTIFRLFTFHNPRYQKLPALFWSLVILVVLFMPGDSLPSETFFPLPFKADKLLHGVLFFVYAWTLSIAFRSTEQPRSITQRTLLITVILAISTEIGQLFIPYRSADVLDVLADMIGVVCFLTIRNLIQSKRTRIAIAETPSDL